MSGEQIDWPVLAEYAWRSFDAAAASWRRRSVALMRQGEPVKVTQGREYVTCWLDGIPFAEVRRPLVVTRRRTRQIDIAADLLTRLGLERVEQEPERSSPRRRSLITTIGRWKR